jgi:outer membrane autotransporter protein
MSGNFNEAASRSSFGGLTLGADYKADSNVILGFAIGGMSPSFSVPNRKASGGASGGNIALYAMARSDFGTYVKGMATGGVFNNWERRMAYHTAVQGSFMSHTWGGTVEVGQRIGGGAFSVTPFAGVQANRLHQNTYSESDPVWGNYYFAHYQSSVPVFAGLQVNASVVAENGITFAPSFRAQWVRETERNRSIQAESLAARGFPWNVVGTKAPQDVLKLDGGLTIGLSDTLKFKGAYNSEVSRQSRSHNWSLRGDYTF